MNKIKSLGFVLLLLIVVLILVIARATNKNLFKQDPENVIATQQNGNTISLVQLNNLTSKYIVVDLGSAENYKSNQFKNSINIPFENILYNTNRKLLNNAKGKIVLFSDDISRSSKAWVILNQLGFENIYIFQSLKNNEVFKYKFQPGTMAKLE
ncbi:MAG: rhodanese-like domain-containing protein [Draconibacterium sp.]|nr:rhodanese-like domain-containing protein [Draconibacterium sp.]